MDAKEIEKLVQESVRNRKPVPDYPKPDPWFCEITALYDHTAHEWVGFVNQHRGLVLSDPDKRKMLHALIDQILDMEEHNDGRTEKND